MPRFLRFNLEQAQGCVLRRQPRYRTGFAGQAVLLDMALTIPSFILSTMQFSGAGEARLVRGSLHAVSWTILSGGSRGWRLCLRIGFWHLRATRMHRRPVL